MRSPVAEFPLRNGLPFLLTAMLILLETVPLYIQHTAAIMPMLALASVYYWAVYRPDLMPPPLLFLLGLMQDLASDDIMGMQALTFVACYAVIDMQRRLFQGKGFVSLLFGFAIIACLSIFLQWLIVGLTQHANSPAINAVFVWLMSIAVFPLLAAGLLVVHRRLPPRA